MKIYPKEIWEWKYWLHLGIVAIVVLGLLEIFSFVSASGADPSHINFTMFNIKNILFSIPLLFLGDVLAHTLLKLN